MRGRNCRAESVNEREVDECDFLIVGSGAAAVCAALAIRALGKRPLIAEKTDLFGGSTALSGGIVWVPNNPVSLRAGVADTPALARTYLDACAGPVTRSSTRARRDAFLAQGPHTISFLEQRGMCFAHSEGWSDYHEGEFPGGLERGRSLEAPVFNLNRLGEWSGRLRRSRGAGDIPVSVREIGAIGLGGRTWASRFAYARAGWRLIQRKLGRHLLARGGSLQGRLLKLALDNDIPIWLEAPVTQLLEQNQRVVGAIVRRHGSDLQVTARSGVLIDAGGFARNRSMRETYSRPPAVGDWTAANPGDTGELIGMAQSLGADTDLMEEAWWIPASFMPDGGILFNSPRDMAKPHCILVDSRGNRYVNEAASYVAAGLAMFERHKIVPAIPSWLVMDKQNREKYAMGLARAGDPPADWIDRGYMIGAASIGELAIKCGMDKDRLSATIERFNGFARAGRDADFHRGDSAYNRFWGDPTMKPNPSLGTIEKPPFFAIKIYPADVGTSGGLVADEHARVLRPDGSPIVGLYATGNSTAALVGRSYPGAGASIGASMVFGYVAARHAAAAP
jgi:3-oxosteroid 1-dehydrogenase